MDAARAGEAMVRNASSLAGSLIPGSASTPEATSTANGRTSAIAPATFSAVSPPARIAGIFERRWAARLQSHVCPEPPCTPSAAVSSRWKSVRKRSSDCRSEAPATRAALMIFAPVRRATSFANTGPSSPCSWTCVSPIPSTACATSSSVGFTNTPTSSTWRRTRRAIPAATASSTARLDAARG